MWINTFLEKRWIIIPFCIFRIAKSLLELYLIFDTETTGLPKRWNAPITDTDNWPRCVQIAWQLHDEWGRVLESKDYLVKPNGFDIPYDAERIHGISTGLAEELAKVRRNFHSKCWPENSTLRTFTSTFPTCLFHSNRISDLQGTILRGWALRECVFEYSNKYGWLIKAWTW